jgi:hypothetical protein
MAASYYDTTPQTVTSETVTKKTITDGIYVSFEDALFSANLFVAQQGKSKLTKGNKNKTGISQRTKCSGCKTKTVQFMTYQLVQGTGWCLYTCASLDSFLLHICNSTGLRVMISC